MAKATSEIFYKTIAEYYESIFPLNEQALHFAKSHVPTQANLLDVGCATGAFSCAIGQFCKHVEAFDLNKKMISLAQQKKQDKVKFQSADMLKLQETYPLSHFDAITCLGNTLVHLVAEEKMLVFLRQAYGVLKEKGVLLLQILNYDKILDEKVEELPTIENDKLRFDRYYHFQNESRLIDFHTILHVKEKRSVIENNSLLCAIRPSELERLLKAAGFSEIHMYSSFSKEALNNEKLPLVIAAFA